MWSNKTRRAKRAMSDGGQAGITLIELVLAIVILSVGMVGVISAFSMVVGSSADPMVRKQMLAIAEQMMEEVSLQPFTPAAPVQANTPGPCASRAAFNDVLDYHNLQTTGGVCDMDGTAILPLAAYNVGVTVDQTAALTTASGTGNLSGGTVYQITVTVTHGGETLTLTGWRANYAAGLT